MDDRGRSSSGPPREVGSVPSSEMDYDRHDQLTAMLKQQETLGSIRTSIEFINRDIRDIKDRDLKELRERDLKEIKDDIKDHGKKLQSIEKRIYAVIVLGMVLGPVVGFILEKIWPTVASTVGHSG